MADSIIENPILNSPFREPDRHFRFDDGGITNEIVSSRRSSIYFIPIAKSKRKGKTVSFDTEWTGDRIEENKTVGRIRDRVGMWRKGGYVSITPTTRRLLEYWNNPERDRKLFFCQIEALETIIYIAEVAKKYGDAWIENELREANDGSNPGLNRLASKMATGSGKTVVMAMLIAWHCLNKLENPQDNRFSDTFLLIAPGITIRDRLRVLLPNDPSNYYRERDIVPPEDMESLGKGKILITNFHSFKLRELIDAPKLNKKILGVGQEKSAFTETPDQMVRRVCRELGNKKNIIILNDEAHHCYRRRPEIQAVEEELTGEDKREAQKRDEEARIWISGIEAIRNKIGVRAIYDLSATPFFLRGSGWPEGTLFPWVVSDFSLIDAIEAGLVKIPRVPVDDNSVTGNEPTYRELWQRIKDAGLPKKGRSTEKATEEPSLPVALEGAIQSLYRNYEKEYRKWEGNPELRARGRTPPVFIVVCNNTNVSKLVYDYISGWEKTLADGSTVNVPGKLSIFSNVDRDKFLARPNTILVDSMQLESGEGMSTDFKKIASHEIENFKNEYRERFPGRDADNITDEDILREVMNTVGKAGKLGEQVKCVVSVSMLTEGWDANTVTHILGVRAFGTQLLCEQVVGRGLRRMSYALNPETGHFDPEYAEVYGVPFSFIPASGNTKDPPIGPIPTRVRALEDRIGLEIRFPRLLGYRYDIADSKLHHKFGETSRLALSTADVPTKVQCDPIVGEKAVHTLDDLRNKRLNEVAFLVASKVYSTYFRKSEEGEKPWLFPQILKITQEWLETQVKCKDDTFPQLLLLAEFANDAASKIYHAIVEGSREQTGAQPSVKPILQPYDTWGSTRYVDFDTTRPVYATRPDKCHISHVVADTGSWEQKMAEGLEDMNEVKAYVKNHNLRFTIPYILNGEQRQYIPDFIARIDDGHGSDNLLNLLVEVSGEAKKEKAQKVDTARTLWVPAVNNHGGLGRWQYIEISDPWDAKNTIRAFLKQLKEIERKAA
ncbi:MAG: DEAD/DEAH box helicase family protein [Alphaproteobacteria bacterium]